uniref:Uncharacterized protein n=1 Tax=viral metagenome TaxID=1070528 RepID=A0A6H1ZTT0_9ZZZZ
MRQLMQNAHIVSGLSNASVSSVTPDYVSLKNYQHLTVIISLKCATGVAACAVTLKQATAVAGTDEKALGFSYQWANADVTTETFTKTAVTSNTFSTAATVTNKVHVIEVDTDTLDVDNSFDCVRVALADAAATTATVTYILSQPRFIDQTTHATSITD